MVDSWALLVPVRFLLQHHSQCLLFKPSSTIHFHRHTGDCAENCVNGVSDNDLADELHGSIGTALTKPVIGKRINLP